MREVAEPQGAGANDEKGALAGGNSAVLHARALEDIDQDSRKPTSNGTNKYVQLLYQTGT